MTSFKVPQIFFCFLIVIFIGFPGTVLGQASTPPDVRTYIQVTTANERSTLDRRTMKITSTADVTLTNISSQTLAVPFHGVIEILNATGPVTMPNASGGPGTAPYGKYYYNLTSGGLADGRLNPREAVTFTVRFVRSSTVTFRYNVIPYGMIAEVNHPPTANAGPDQTRYVTDRAILNGSGSSDVDGDLLSFNWSFISRPAGSIATLENPTTVNPSFIIDRPGSYTLQLMVNDGKVDSAPDTVTISTLNSAPVAKAGPDQTVYVGDTVTLDGRASGDVDGDPLSFNWSLLSSPADSMAALDNPSLDRPHFVADQPGSYVLQLLVNDGKVNSSPDSVTISTVNSRPVANAGPNQNVHRNEQTQLNGSASSDVDHDALTYFWSIINRPEGSTASLDNAQIVNPSFKPDMAGLYVIQLIVNDGSADSLPSTTTITVTPAMVPVPNIVGLSQTAAESLIIVSSLAVGAISTANDPLVTAGLVISQNPGAGTLTPEGSAIDFSVSLGPVMATVPNVTGMTQTAATAAIQAAGLQVGTITTANSSTVQAGQVISQAPSAGTSVAQGSPVNINISLGPVMVVVPDVTGMTQAAANSAITGANLTVGTFTQASSATVPAGRVISQNPSAGNSVPQGTAVSLVISTGPALPPDPGTVAPKLNLTVATDTFSATQFLYTGANPIQTGVAPGTIEFRRAAVIRGKVLSMDGSPLPAVIVSILNHPEFGRTVSRADGMFDLVVNGGGYLAVNYSKDGYLGAQRQVNVPWQDYVVLPEVILLQLDPNVTPIDLTIPGIKASRGSVSTDSDGSRQATLFFPEGITAIMVMPDGSTLPLTNLNVRATEFTVGPNGPKAMPAELPPNVAYTYAVEFTVDEALAVGAKEVRFSQPVINYLENFLNFPVGTAVPAGYYDRTRGQWVASDSGKVIRIMGITAGLADLDTDGNGTADNLLGISDAERARLAELYPVNQTLWRVPIPHFSTWDLNWGFYPPLDAVPPDQPPPSTEQPKDDPCKEKGSIIECQNQILGERINLSGTRYSLNYTSGPVPGRQYLLKIPLSGNTIPSSLQRIDLQVSVAGRLFLDSVPAAANQTYTFYWDGLDAYGRKVQGGQFAYIGIGYIYTGKYGKNDQFGYNGGGIIEGSRTRLELGFWQRKKVPIGHWLSIGQALGGWSIDVHHIYDRKAKTLYLGNGTRQSTEFLNNLNVINTIVGNGQRCISSTPGYPTCGDEGPAIEAAIGQPMGIAIGPDGSIYLTNTETCTIKRVHPNGIITNFAGQPGTCRYDGDGGPAIDAHLGSMLYDLAFGPDGSLYVTDRSNFRIRKIDPNGIINTVAGDGVRCYSGNPLYPACGDGGPATSASIEAVLGFDVGPEGSLYLVEPGNNRVRRVGPDGIISTVAGLGVAGFSGDGGQAVAAMLKTPIDVAVARDGALYISDQGNYVIRRVGVDGIIRTVAGTPGVSGYEGDGGRATLAKLDSPRKIFVDTEGVLYINVSGRPVLLNFPRIRRLWPNGTIDTLAGNGTQGFSGDLGPAINAQLYHIDGGMAVSPVGSLYFADQYNRRVRKVNPAMPGLDSNETIFIPSREGEVIYTFDWTGRHLRTKHSLTGTTLYEFGYDAEGFLVTVTDGDGNVTTIERDSQGNPTALVGPYGHRTTLNLDSNGYISRITNPAGESLQFVYSNSGLMSQMTDARGNTYDFTYDNLGRLTLDKNLSGGSIELARIDDVDGYTVVKKTALNHQTSYRVEQPLVGPKKIVNTFPGGATTTSTTGNDGTKTITFTDGNTASASLAPDPRFGVLRPIEGTSRLSTPAGLVLNASRQRSAVLTDPFDPFSLTTQTDTLTVNGNTYTSMTDVTSKTVAAQSPEGRALTLSFDAQGRVLSYQLAGINPATTSYDLKGRPSQIAQGDMKWSMTYDPQGRVSSVKDAADKTITYAYDSANRRTSTSLPSGRLYGFGYDGNRNLSSITMPNGSTHLLEYNPVNHLTSYTFPGGSKLSYTFNSNQDLSKIMLPLGREIQLSYDTSGRQSLLKYPEAAIIFSYTDATRKIASLSRTTGASGLDQAFAYTYDGPLLTSATWSGISTGSYQYLYNNDFRLITMKLDSESPIGFTYDRDGLLTGCGPFTVIRNGPAGATSQVQDGVLTIDYTYDASGRLTGRSYRVSGTPIYSFTNTWDKQNRIPKKIETLLGTTRTYDYFYDSDGQLTRVDQDGTTVENYLYDANGNRTLSGSISASYDPQDRITGLGTVPYSVSNDGFLSSRGENDKFTYSAAGELIGAIVGTQAIDYAYDGLGHLVARKGSSGTEQYFYGDPTWPVRLTATRSITGELTEYLYETGGTLIAFRRGGTWYYVGTDQVGSPRIVVGAGGTPLKTIEYDSFGKTLSDTAPSFYLPVGFAGGIKDSQTGLIRFGSRDYDPETGRWTARDPIFFASGQPNLYSYVGNNPVHVTDPLGWWGVGGIGVATLEGGIGRGAGGQVAIGGGFFSGPQGKSIGAFESHGGPEEGQAIGVYAGYSGGVFFTNADCAEQLRGPADTYNLNLPFISVSLSVSEDWTTMLSVTGGPSLGASVSRYTTHTSAIGSPNF